MTLAEARAICHPTQCGPQDRTLALADELIGAENQRTAKLEAEANISPEYRAASKALETLSINLHAYCRGMVGKQVVPAYIKEAREQLDRMEAAVSQ